MSDCTAAPRRTVKVGQPAPDFCLPTTADLEGLSSVASLADYKGKWLVLFFYPLDFTFVCPTEILAMSERAAEFKDAGAEILGVSTDSVHSHRAWIRTPREQNGLGSLNFPLGGDTTLAVARDYGVLIEEKGIALRGLFIIDPDGVLRYSVVHDLNIGRSVDETLRVLQALQAGGLCPVNWKRGEKLLNP